MSCNPAELRQVPLFALLDDEELAVLAGQVESKIFAPRQRIYKIGEPGGWLRLAAWALQSGIKTSSKFPARRLAAPDKAALQRWRVDPNVQAKASPWANLAGPRERMGKPEALPLPLAPLPSPD